MDRDTTIEDLEGAVRAAEARLESVCAKLRENGARDARDDLRLAAEERSQARRKLAAARAQEWAEPISWSPVWDTGAPSPHVIASGLRVHLLYLVDVPDPHWDGSYANIVDPSAPVDVPLAIVEFERCYSHKFGGPNDEVFHGHPLASAGFDGYGAFLVHNSRWLQEARATDSVHHRHEPGRWTGMRHYLLAFHDEIFECLAHGYHVKVTTESFASALTHAVQRVIR